MWVLIVLIPVVAISNLIEDNLSQDQCVQDGREFLVNRPRVTAWCVPDGDWKANGANSLTNEREIPH